MPKNIIDRSLAAIALLFLSPVILVLACIIRVRMGSPVMFRQTRIGLDERAFQFLKFRTMTDARDQYGKPMSDAVRLTPFGQFLRSTSLDELPQLINVLTGDMSLVGPRPLLPQYLPLYNADQRRRHTVKPGITGWAQINGRNSLSWKEKFDLDIWYVDHCSLSLYFRILWLTVVSVIRRDGISQEGNATMPEFTGNPVTTDRHE